MAAFAVVGAGVVGTAVATLLKDRGYVLTGIAGRNTERLERVTLPADIVFITTNDSAIAEVAEAISAQGGFSQGQTIIHMSGALPSSVLQPATKAGAKILSIHPLQSFANVEMAIANLPGSYFTIEGDDLAYPLAEKIINDLGGKCFYIKDYDKAIYHAAACTASNYIVSVIDYSIKLLEQIGIPVEEGGKALLPLIQGTINNIHQLGTERALTGPIARGDIGTIEKHMHELKAREPEYIELYSQLGLYTVQVALKKGSIDDSKAGELRKILRGNKNE